jgi:large subunit ribosomal protein L15
LEQHELRPPRGAKRARKRIGRGNASGHGTYAGRGIKGQQARAGSGVRHAFEGGQTPLVRRLPVRRGFHNPFRIEYLPVNLRALAKLPANSEVTPESLRAAGIIGSLRKPIKILGDGELAAALTVRAHRISAAARSKIEAAGGSVEELTPRRTPEQRRNRKHLREKRPEASTSGGEAAAASNKKDRGGEAAARSNKKDSGGEAAADPSEKDSDDDGSESASAE